MHSRLAIAATPGWREIHPFLITAFLIAVQFATSACDRPALPEQRLNLILISLDTSRSDAFGSYGAARDNSPNLDRLARESVRFSDAISQSTATAPSHMSLLTGQFVHRHGLVDNATGIDPSATLASLLRDAGWKTAAFTGHGSFRAQLGHAHGFDAFDSWVGEERWPYSRNMQEVLPRAEVWLAREAEEPFFLLVHGYDPHCPYWPPAHFRDRYTADYTGPLEAETLCDLEDFGPLIEAGKIGPDETKYLRDLYEAEVAAADAEIGGFLDLLRERELLDRSVVVFTSDHGEVFEGHDWIGHTNLWEAEMQVPLLIRFPRGEWARTIESPVQHVDVAPTVLTALGVAAPPGLQGLDLMPAIRGEAALPDERLRISRVGPLESVRFDRRWKISYLRRGDRLTVEEPRLFDLQNDPDETTNLFDTDAGKKRFQEILIRYTKFRSQTKGDDALYEGHLRDPLTTRNAAMLKALGYIDGADDSAAEIRPDEKHAE